jgi:acetyl-CoA carboxylase biotin carboxyl carrier protein
MTEVRAPMVGKVIEILVQPGAAVSEEDELLILESMKMEIPVPAPASGTVQDIHVNAGDSVQENDLLVTLA